jgi:hypothetical protein
MADVSEPISLQRNDSVRVIQVVHVQTLRGLGTSADDSVRTVHQFWSLDGRLLAEFDPCDPVRGEHVVGP